MRIRSTSASCVEDLDSVIAQRPSQRGIATVTPVEDSDRWLIDFHDAIPENKGVAAGIAVGY